MSRSVTTKFQQPTQAFRNRADAMEGLMVLAPFDQHGFLEDNCFLGTQSILSEGSRWEGDFVFLSEGKAGEQSQPAFIFSHIEGVIQKREQKL